MKHAFLIAISTLLIACSSQGPISKSAYQSAANQDAVLWQQTSAEYEALCHQAYNLATQRLITLSQMANFKSGMAIVMDLDETVLDNSPYNAALVKNGKSYTENSWNKWVMQIDAEPVPGAVQFIQMAKNLKFQVFFVSNRSVEVEAQTLENLMKIGIEVDRSQLLLKETESSKVQRREKVKNMGEIAMLVGDNLADFNDAFDFPMSSVESRKEALLKYSENFGVDYIILPNPMYGSWKSVLPSNPIDALKTANQ